MKKILLFAAVAVVLSAGLVLASYGAVKMLMPTAQAQTSAPPPATKPVEKSEPTVYAVGKLEKAEMAENMRLDDRIAAAEKEAAAATEDWQKNDPNVKAAAKAFAAWRKSDPKMQALDKLREQRDRDAQSLADRYRLVPSCWEAKARLDQAQYKRCVDAKQLWGIMSDGTIQSLR